MKPSVRDMSPTRNLDNDATGTDPAPDNDQRPHRAPPPRRPRFPQPSQLPAPHAPHRRRPEPTTPHSTLKSPLTCRNPHAGVADPMPVHRPHSVERADILFVWGRVNQAGHVVS
jgi:hypothetical protein